MPSQGGPPPPGGIHHLQTLPSVLSDNSSAAVALGQPRGMGSFSYDDNNVPEWATPAIDEDYLERVIKSLRKNGDFFNLWLETDLMIAQR